MPQIVAQSKCVSNSVSIQLCLKCICPNLKSWIKKGISGCETMHLHWVGQLLQKYKNTWCSFEAPSYWAPIDHVRNRLWAIFLQIINISKPSASFQICAATQHPAISLLKPCQKEFAYHIPIITAKHHVQSTVALWKLAAKTKYRHERVGGDGPFIYYGPLYSNILRHWPNQLETQHACICSAVR